MGVEPTTRLAKSRIAGFEGREDHRIPFASAFSLQSLQNVRNSLDATALHVFSSFGRSLSADGSDRSRLVRANQCGYQVKQGWRTANFVVGMLGRYAQFPILQ